MLPRCRGERRAGTKTLCLGCGEYRPRMVLVRRPNCQIRYRIPSAAARRQKRRAGPWAKSYSTTEVSTGAREARDADVVASVTERDADEAASGAAAEGVASAGARDAELPASACSVQARAAVTRTRIAITRKGQGLPLRCTLSAIPDLCSNNCLELLGGRGRTGGIAVCPDLLGVLVREGRPSHKEPDFPAKVFYFHPCSLGRHLHEVLADVVQVSRHPPQSLPGKVAGVLYDSQPFCKIMLFAGILKNPHTGVLALQGFPAAAPRVREYTLCEYGLRRAPRAAGSAISFGPLRPVFSWLRPAWPLSFAQRPALLLPV